MILFNKKAHDQFMQLIESQDGIISIRPDFYPLYMKAYVWFDETVFHIFAKSVHKKDEASPKKDMKCIEFLINIWIKFPDNTSEETALGLEKFLDQRIKAIDNNYYAQMWGKSLFVNHMWSKNPKRPHLIYTCAIPDFSVRSDIVEKYKEVLREAQDIFKFSYSDNKNDCIKSVSESDTSILIRTYIEFLSLGK
jgi:hypothetical protein